MCGIHFCLGGKKEHIDTLLKSRGPDKTNYVYFKNAHCTFYRLAIVGMTHGDQPFLSEQKNSLTMVNGEIYNYKELQFMLNLENSPVLGSDCEIIHRLFEKGLTAIQICRILKGEWAFLHYSGDQVYFARDKLGRKPLYYLAESQQNSQNRPPNQPKILAVSSTIESLLSYKTSYNEIHECLPGVLYFSDIKMSEPSASLASMSLASVVFHQFMLNSEIDFVNGVVFYYSDFYKLFVNAVCRRISQSDQPVGFLLSGGFDSSLVLSVALKWHKFKKPPHVFTFGFEEKAPDILAAEKVVKYLREIHGPNCIEWHKVIGKVEDGLQSLSTVVKLLETCDITTIRASTPMFLISQYIAQNTNVKVLLSGEGSDELFGGYLYFMYAPSDIAFQAEIIKLLKELYMFDVRRADRTTAANGLEVRTPFLDDDFIRYFMNYDLCKKNVTISKEFIRDVIAKTAPALLPEDILQGKKEAFSDAVGYSWKDSIENFAKTELKKSEINTPENMTSEALYYQLIFETYFGIPKETMMTHYWLPNKDWIDTGNEPSARALKNYNT
jgi:asparagine synthase (glutamine-hydrolysing)